MRQHLTIVLTSAVTTLVLAGLFVTIASAIAAPTQAPPNGNPAFPLTGPQGPQGTQGPAGPAGATGPQGTWAPNRCQVCFEDCDFNGSGPCVQTCAVEGNGWSSGATLPGDVDGNDRVRVFFDCW